MRQDEAQRKLDRIVGRSIDRPGGGHLLRALKIRGGVRSSGTVDRRPLGTPGCIGNRPFDDYAESLLLRRR